MRNIVRLLRDETARLFANAVSVIITVGLVVLPSLFAWYNILACWDVFDNTGNLTVAVASADEGYESDLVPLRVNVGEQVISALRANDQIDWTFTTEEDAIDGTRAGRYYAAVVIPASFSRDMLTFAEDGGERANVVYYANEKKNAIAPKITGQGADTVSYQVNETFAKTLSEVALGMANALSRAANDADAAGTLTALTSRMDEVALRMEQGAAALDSFEALARSAQRLAEGSASLIGSAQGRIDRTTEAADGALASAGSLAGTLAGTVDDLVGALDRSAEAFAGVPASVDALFDTAAGNADANAGELRAKADEVDGQIAAYREIVAALEQAREAASEDARPALDRPIAAANESIALMVKVSDGLRAAADELASGAADATAAHEELTALAQDARHGIEDARRAFDEDARPALQQLAADAAALGTDVDEVAGALGSAGSTLAGSAASVGSSVGDTAEGIAAAASELRTGSAEMRDLADRLDAALAAADSEAASAILGADVQTLAQALAAPVGIERTAVYPVENFGSAMAPLYSTLALFIGSLLILVTMRPAPSAEALARLDRPKPYQAFLGHFGTIAVLSLLQSTVMGLGNLFFLQVQAAHPLLFMASFWTAGLAFSFIIYALVATFANLGKAIAVLLLIVQVTGCGGSYPLQLLPGFIQALSPYLPATHAVDAMRAAMMGTFGNDFWVSLGLLALSAVPAGIMALALRRPLARFMHWFVERAESSRLIG